MTGFLKRITPTGTDGLLNAPVIGSAVMLLLFVHAMFVKVVIHPFFYTPYCLVPLLLPGGALSAYALLRVARGKAHGRVGPGGIFALLLLPFFGAACLWMVAAKTPAWTAALLFGEPHSEIREFHVRSHGGKGCDYRAHVVDHLRLLPSYFCVPEPFGTHYLGQRITVRLSGEQTWLGFRISHYEHVPGDQVPSP